MKLVLDTNTLISALLTKNTPPDQLYQAWVRGLFHLVSSDWQLSVYQRNLRLMSPSHCLLHSVQKIFHFPLTTSDWLIRPVCEEVSLNV